MELQSENTLTLWVKALEAVKAKGLDYEDGDGRICREVLNLQTVLENPSDSGIDLPIGILSDRNKWVYPSKEELTSIMFKEIQAPIYEYTYGGRIFNYAGVANQLDEYILPLLKKNPFSRRATIVLYNPVQDSKISNSNTPGIVHVQFHLRSGLLHITATIRSCDIFFGWPANIYQIFHLQKHVAQKLGVAQGNISIIANSAHLFRENFEDAGIVAGKVK